MKKRNFKLIALSLAAVAAFPTWLTACSNNGGDEVEEPSKPIASYSFEEIDGYTTLNDGTGKYDKLNYIFSDDNAEYLEKSRPRRS